MDNNKKLSDLNLTLFMTEGMSIEKWHNYGMLNRELALYKEINKKIRSVKIFSYGNSDENLFIKDTNIEVLNWIFKRGSRFVRSLGLFIHYRKLSNSSIIKTNQISGSLAAVRAKFFFNKPLIIRCGYLASTFSRKRDDDELVLKNIIQLEKKAFYNADKIIVTCQRDKNVIIKNYSLNKKNIHIVPNYVDTDLFKPIEKIKKISGRLCYVGRLDKQKNLYNLFQAIEKVKYVKELIVIGDGPLKKELTKISKKMLTKVKFLGIISNDDLPKLIQSAEVFILPSLYEGMPKTILEAMSCGMPCIGASTEGIKEIIINRKNGLLSNIDSKSIANSLKILFKDKKLRDLLSKNARNEILNNYSLNKIVQLELKIYQELLGNK